MSLLLECIYVCYLRRAKENEENMSDVILAEGR